MKPDGIYETAKGLSETTRSDRARRVCESGWFSFCVHKPSRECLSFQENDSMILRKMHMRFYHIIIPEKFRS